MAKISPEPLPLRTTAIIFAGAYALAGVGFFAVFLWKQQAQIQVPLGLFFPYLSLNLNVTLHQPSSFFGMAGQLIFVLVGYAVSGSTSGIVFAKILNVILLRRHGRELSGSTSQAYFDEALRSLRGHKRLAEGAMAQVPDEEFFGQLDPEANSIATLVKHMAGNMRSRFTDFLTSDGEKPDRYRDREFLLDADTSRAEVMRRWEAGWACVFSAIEPLRPEDLSRTVTIRGDPHSVLMAIHRQVTHYAYHVGQIVLLAKHMRGAEWKSLSIPRGKSEEFNARMAAGERPPRP